MLLKKIVSLLDQKQILLTGRFAMLDTSHNYSDCTNVLFLKAYSSTPVTDNYILTIKSMTITIIRFRSTCIL